MCKFAMLQATLGVALFYKDCYQMAEGAHAYPPKSAAGIGFMY